MPALYPAKPCTFGAPPSVSGSVLLGHCATPPERVISRRVLRDASRFRATVTLPADPEQTGPHCRDPRGIAQERVVGALNAPYGGGLFNSLENVGRSLEETVDRSLVGGIQWRSALGFAFGGSKVSMAIGLTIGSSSAASSSSSAFSSSSARQNARVRAS